MKTFHSRGAFVRFLLSFICSNNQRDYTQTIKKTFSMFWCRHFLLWISATFSLSKIQDTRYKNERKLRVNSGRLLKERRVEWPITVFPFFPFVSRFLIFKASFVKKSRTINYKNKLFTRKKKKRKTSFLFPQANNFLCPLTPEEVIILNRPLYLNKKSSHAPITIRTL